MKVLSYKNAVDRIEWERWLKLSALKDNVLSAVAQKLYDFKPNTPSNIKHPWRLSERHSLRAWCPRHDGRWAKLIVRANDAGHVVYDCTHGCTHEEVEGFLSGATRAPHGRNAETIAPAPIGASGEAAGNVVYDARARFRRSSTSDAA